MAAKPGEVRAAPQHAGGCKLVVREQEALSDVLRFVLEGLEVGQQVVAVAGPGCLKQLARALAENGLRPDSLLNTGRMVFLTAPDCVSRFRNLRDSKLLAPLRRKGPMLRWVSDWSWAYSNGRSPAEVLDCQHRLHEFVRSLDALSLCTVHGRTLERASLLAFMADHRRAARLPLPV